MHEWTYEAMVYDLLPVEGNVIRWGGGAGRAFFAFRGPQGRAAGGWGARALWRPRCSARRQARR
jgi:hypothetical protein